MNVASDFSVVQEMIQKLTENYKLISQKQHEIIELARSVPVTRSNKQKIDALFAAVEKQRVLMDLLEKEKKNFEEGSFNSNATRSMVTIIKELRSMEIGEYNDKIKQSIKRIKKGYDFILSQQLEIHQLLIQFLEKRKQHPIIQGHHVNDVVQGHYVDDAVQGHYVDDGSSYSSVETSGITRPDPDPDPNPDPNPDPDPDPNPDPNPDPDPDPNPDPNPDPGLNNPGTGTDFITSAIGALGTPVNTSFGSLPAGVVYGTTGALAGAAVYGIGHDLVRRRRASESSRSSSSDEATLQATRSGYSSSTSDMPPLIDSARSGSLSARSDVSALTSRSGNSPVQSPRLSDASAIPEQRGWSRIDQNFKHDFTPRRDRTFRIGLNKGTSGYERRWSVSDQRFVKPFDATRDRRYRMGGRHKSKRRGLRRTKRRRISGRS